MEKVRSGVIGPGVYSYEFSNAEIKTHPHASEEEAAKANREYFTVYSADYYVCEGTGPYDLTIKAFRKKEEAEAYSKYGMSIYTW